MRLLIVAPNWIGDTLLAQPLFARLHALRPGLALEAAAPAWTAPVLRRMPEIETVFETPLVHGRIQLGARLRLAAALRERRYDEAIVLPNSWKSALAPFLAGIPRRVGFRGEARYALLNVVHPLDEQATPLMAERYAQLAEAPGRPGTSRRSPARSRRGGAACGSSARPPIVPPALRSPRSPTARRSTYAAAPTSAPRSTSSPRPRRSCRTTRA